MKMNILSVVVLSFLCATNVWAQGISVESLTKNKVAEIAKTPEGICQMETLSMFASSTKQPKLLPNVIFSEKKGDIKVVTTSVDNPISGTELKMNCEFKQVNGKFQLITISKSY